MEIRKNLHNFLLVSIIPQKTSDEELLKELEELQSLVHAFGGEVKGLVVQRREVHDRGMYIGRGKVEEVANSVAKNNIDVVVLNAKVKPGQLFEIKKGLLEKNSKIEVWDRVDLILHIFSSHAHSSEAKMQIELASMRHMGPRIYGMGIVLSRQGGGVGTRGLGETNTELMKRHWRDQIKKVQDKINKHTEDRKQQLERRVQNGLQTVSIIGYTNAGKTSLFNLLTGKKNDVENALFVTLDSSTGKIFLKDIKKEIIISDTIGFIRNLPTSLIDAFKSTLMETVYSDLLLVVIDAADMEVHKKIDVVEQILNELNMYSKNKIFVFNKTELVDIETLDKLSKIYRRYNPQFISVKENKGIDNLLTTTSKLLEPTGSSILPND